MMGFGDAVASDGPYANICTSLQIISPTPHQSMFTGRMLLLTPTNSVNSVVLCSECGIWLPEHAPDRSLNVTSNVAV